jgi:cold shock CspA family protein
LEKVHSEERKESSVRGTITYFDHQRSFGLIDCEQSTRRVFFHVNAVRLDALGRQLPLATRIRTRVDRSIRGFSFSRIGGRDALVASFHSNSK